MPDQRELDVVVYGATGFVGRLTAAHLAEHAPPEARIGLAGRSAEKLERVRAELGARAADWPLIVADQGDPASLAAMARRARAVATTVGPYRRQGLALVDACVEAGTHYADLTGEVLFVRESLERHDRAAAAGARIVHSCGFDSIPSDLAVHLLHETARADDAGTLGETRLVVRAARGGVSGGTLASLKGQIDEMKTSAEARRIANDPYALAPGAVGGGDRDSFAIGRDRELGVWVAPFVMALYNTRIVHRSNALLDGAYGPGFRYSEVVSAGRGPLGPVLAAAMTAGLAALAGGLALPPTRKLLDRVLPQPGEGPSEKTRRTGYFRTETHTTTSSGARYRATVAATGDPGYAATAVMLGESALCLALDGDRLPDRAGVLTPATAMGDALVDRLRVAGMTLAVARA